MIGIDGWTARSEERTDRVTVSAARALHDLLEAPGPAPGAGDPLPLLWHWLSFLPQAPQSQLSADGHPATGDFLPPVHGRRRMAAGGQVRVTGSARVEEELARKSMVTEVIEKQGSTGRLLFVTVERELADDNRPLIEERSDIVYRDPQPAGAAARQARETTPAGLDDPQWEWGREIRIEPTLLFRFSALTYNAHRIHYDRDYATNVEGYPGLVVHGPLQAVLLAELLRRSLPDETVGTFAFRSRSAAFDNGPLHVRGRLDTDGSAEKVHLAALDHTGRPTMTATAQIGTPRG